MSERLDRIEAQQAINTSNIANLVTMSGNLLSAAELSLQESRTMSGRFDRFLEESRMMSQRFEILRQEAIADRQAMREQAATWDARFNALLLEIQHIDGRIEEILRGNAGRGNIDREANTEDAEPSEDVP